MPEYLVVAGLALIMALTLVLPFSVKKVEEELEIFLFIMGVIAVTISGLWSGHLVLEAMKEPLPITAAVLGLGFVFRAVRPRLKGWLNWLVFKTGLTGAIFLMVLFLGLASSLITAIIASLLLAEIFTVLRLRRDFEVKAVVYACFAIGLGAALTPLGEPLSTIVVSKLKGPPHYADFFYLLRLLGAWIIPGVLLCSWLAARGAGEASLGKDTLQNEVFETPRVIVMRAVKIYFFVMALIFLGAGLAPLAERFIARTPTWALYWINMVSAILDNATLAAAEIVPSMTRSQIDFLLMGLLVSGGMLIPGNIPNIVSAAKLGIKSSEWAKVAVPFGLVLMTAYFVLMMIFVK